MEFLFAVGREALFGLSGRLRGRLRARRVGVRGRVSARNHLHDPGCGPSAEPPAQAFRAPQPSCARGRVGHAGEYRDPGGGCSAPPVQMISEARTRRLNDASSGP